MSSASSNSPILRFRPSNLAPRAVALASAATIAGAGLASCSSEDKTPTPTPASSGTASMLGTATQGATSPAPESTMPATPGAPQSALVDVPAGAICSPNSLPQQETSVLDGGMIDFYERTLAVVNNHGNPIDPTTLKTTSLNFVESAFDRTMSQDYSTPEGAMQHASFIGAIAVTAISYAHDGINVSAKITEEPTMNRTTSNPGETITFCVPHRAGTGNGMDNTTPILVLDSRYELPATVGDTMKIVLDAKGNLVPFIGAMNYDKNGTFYSNRTKLVDYPDIYKAWSTAWYGSQWQSAFSNFNYPDHPAYLAKMSNEFQARVNKAAADWMQANNGLPGKNARNNGLVGAKTNGVLTPPQTNDDGKIGAPTSAANSGFKAPSPDLPTPTKSDDVPVAQSDRSATPTFGAMGI